MTERHIVGPGDDDTVRLVISSGLTRNSLMKLETGEAMPVFYLDVVSRSLASVDELETRSLGFSEGQLVELAQQIINVVSDG